jgi:hypothetical protein
MPKKPRTDKPEQPSYVPASWRQPGEVGMSFAAHLDIVKRLAPMTPRGSAGEAIASALGVESDGKAASFRRGRIWA